MMMRGELLPSSIVTFLSPATLQICSPTSRLPVNVILRTRASAHSASPTSLPLPVMHWMPSAGTPHSSRSAVSFSALSGVSVAGFRMTLLPAASAGPTLCATRCRGKLNGLMPTTTPHGTRNVNHICVLTPGAPSSGMTSPYRRFASSAERARISAARVTSNRASPMILPSSSVIVRAKSSARARSRSEALRRIWNRSYPVRRRIAAAPRTAVASARSTSSGSALGIVSISEPSYGFSTGIVCRLSTHSFPTYVFMIPLPPRGPAASARTAQAPSRKIFPTLIHVCPVELQHLGPVQFVQPQPPVPGEHGVLMRHVLVRRGHELDVAELARRKVAEHLLQPELDPGRRRRPEEHDDVAVLEIVNPKPRGEPLHVDTRRRGHRVVRTRGRRMCAVRDRAPDGHVVVPLVGHVLADHRARGERVRPEQPPPAGTGHDQHREPHDPRPRASA